MNVGDVLKADVFAEGDKVDVVGVSKGKGYQGVIKRYGQHLSLIHISTREGVFAGGDAVMGARTVVEAVAVAKKVAESMDAYMKSLPAEEAADRCV